MPSISSTIIDLPRLKIKASELKTDRILIHMEPDLRFKPRCSYCEAKAHPNRNHKREIRDLACFQHKVYINFTYREIICGQCGTVIEKFEFVTPYARVTTRMAEAVGHLCKYMNLSEVAKYFALDWKTVREIDKYYIKKQLEELPLNNIRVIGMDEVACKKGHQYFTVIYDLERNQLLRIVEGRTEKAVSQFFQEMGDHCKNVKAVAVDMWQPYTNVVKKYCPWARIVYDKFHIISNYHKIIDIVRRREFAQASVEGKALLKGSRYLLLKNKGNLKESGKDKLENILEYNKQLNVVYTLKEQLQAIWDNVTVPSFLSALNQWCDMARETDIPELTIFANTLERHTTGLISYCLYPINTGPIEAHNITINLVKRKARGFHDNEYFKLKIFQAINLRDGPACQL